MCYFVCLHVHPDHKTMVVLEKILSYIHKDHIAPNLIFIATKLERDQTSMSHGNDMTGRPCDLVGLRKVLK